MLSVFASTVRRELLLAWRRRFDLATTVSFFVLASAMFPLGIGPEPALLATAAPGVLWTGALFASVLALPRLFAADHADGTLEQMLLSPHPLSVIVAAKLAAHWLVAGLPLVLLAPLLALQFGLPPGPALVLAASLLAGTPALACIGAIGAALTLGVRGGGLLSALIVLPLYAPVLVFGAGAVGAHASGIGAASHLLLLGALSLAAAALSPWASAAALRIALE